MINAWDIVAYAYHAEILCLDCVRNLAAAHLLLDGQRYLEALTEELLDRWARLKGISDRRDERSFDSGDFPKVVFSSDVEGYECAALPLEDCDICHGEGWHPERCGNCGEEIDG